MVTAVDTAGKEWTLTGGAGAMATQAPNQALPANPRAPPTTTTAPPQQQQPPAASMADFSGIGSTLKQLGYTMYDPHMLKAELSLQWEIQRNAARQATFKDFKVNYGRFQVYIAMIGDQKTITVIHTLDVFYSLKQATNAYQDKVLAFIGDRQATK
jgi:hypothetical protein